MVGMGSATSRTTRAFASTKSKVGALNPGLAQIISAMETGNATSTEMATQPARATMDMAEIGATYPALRISAVTEVSATSKTVNPLVLATTVTLGNIVKMLRDQSFVFQLIALKNATKSAKGTVLPECAHSASSSEHNRHASVLMNAVNISMPFANSSLSLLPLLKKI